MNDPGFLNNITDLDDSDKILIDEIFQEKVAPKLFKLSARLGTINCEFAGEKYQNWNISFRSSGSGFLISDFEYDEDGASIDLDL